MATTTKTLKFGTLGICPVCEGEFKVRDGKLVHHGFTRPGTGSIHGDCFAVWYEPYERSTKGCEDYKLAVTKQLAMAEKALAALPTRTYFRTYNVFNRTHTDYAVGVTELRQMERVFAAKTHDLEHEIKGCKSEIARMDKLIAAWQLKDLKVVTEEAVTAQITADRAARKAERDAKNAAKAAKAVALQAKRDAKQAEKVAFLKDFVAKLTAAKGDKAMTQKLISDFKAPKTLRKFGHFWCADWAGLEEEMLALGFAERFTDGRIVVQLY